MMSSSEDQIQILLCAHLLVVDFYVVHSRHQLRPLMSQVEPAAVAPCTQHNYLTYRLVNIYLLLFWLVLLLMVLQGPSACDSCCAVMPAFLLLMLRQLVVLCLQCAGSYEVGHNLFDSGVSCPGTAVDEG